MTALSSESYKELDSQFRVCMEVLISKLTQGSADHVTHYLQHGELEMAYESLVLSCIAEKLDCDKHTAVELQSIGIKLGMDSESVFDANFWQHAQQFFTQPSSTTLNPPPST